MARGKTGIAETSSGDGLEQTLSAPAGPNAAKITDVDQIIRQGFIRKVYGILCIQLLTTTVIVAGLMYFACSGAHSGECNSNAREARAAKIPGTPKNFVLDNPAALTWGSYGVAFAALLVLVCCQSQSRIYPRNVCILGLFTVCESVFLGMISIQYTAWSVALSAGVTVVVVAVLTAFACFTKIDFTGMGMYLYVSLICMMLFSFVASFVFMNDSMKYMRTFQLVYAGVGCLIFSLYLVYDTQLIMGGNHKKFQFTVDDYVFAALSIYLDVINLFIFILSILGENR